jgi:Sulfotransferase family
MDRLVWIFGSSRSGSTWLLRMLSEVDGVVPIDDPHLGHHLGVWRPIPLAWAASPEPPDLTTLLEVKKDQPGYFFAERYRDQWWEPLKQLITARFEAQGPEHLNGYRGDPVYVVKEPGSHVAGLLTELFPRSTLIFLLRDGRDVVDSWLAAYRDGSWAIPEGAFPVAPWGRLSLLRWLADVWVYRTAEVRRAFEAHAPDRRVLVRYEDLRTDTQRALADVCAAAGLSADAVAAIAERHSFDQVPEAERGESKAIRSAEPGGWRQNLTPAEQAALEEIMGPTLAELGYESSTAASRAAA